MSSFSALSSKAKLLVIVFFLVVGICTVDMFYILYRFYDINTNKERVQFFNELTHHEYIPASSFVKQPSNGDTYEPVRVDINSLGIRGPELGEKKTYRVLMLGDSFVQADEVRFEDTFGERLNKKFKGKIEFISHGIGSWSPTTELSWLYHRGLLLKPDEVNLFLCINDFGGDTKYRNLATFNGDGIPVRYDISKEATSMNRVLRDSSIIYSVFTFAKSFFKKKQKVTGERRTFSDDILLFCTNEKGKWPDNYRAWYGNTIKSLVGMHSLLSKNHIELNVYLVPMGYSWTDEILLIRNHHEEYKKLKDWAISQKKLEEILYNDLNELGINFIKLEYLFDSFKKRFKNQKLFNGSDGHWNKNGHMVLSQFFEEYYNTKNRLSER